MRRPRNAPSGSHRSTRGIVVGNAITDAAGRAPSSTDTKVLPDTAGVLRLNGYKFYSTGTLFADVVAVSAVDANGLDVQAIIPADRAGVELFDDWDGFGQRTTASGGTRFTEVEVRPHEVVTVSDGTHLGHATAFLQLYLAAVAVGIAYAVLDDAVDYVRTKARPASHSVADTADTDPFVLQAVGEISAAAASGEAVVLAAADAIDRLVDQGRHDDRGSVAGVAVTVAKAQLVAERLTLSAAERVFDTGGASATARALNLDRHWRNARTVATPQSVGVQGICGGRLRRQRCVATGQRLLLSHPPPPPHPPPQPPPPPQPLLPPPLPPPADQRFLRFSCSAGVNRLKRRDHKRGHRNHRRGYGRNDDPAEHRVAHGQMLGANRRRSVPMRPRQHDSPSARGRAQAFVSASSSSALSLVGISLPPGNAGTRVART